jgi:hypothetical protein
LLGEGEAEAWRVDRAGEVLRVVLGRPGPPAPPPGSAGWTGDEAVFLGAVAPLVAGHVPRVVAHDPTIDVLVLSGADPPGHETWASRLTRGGGDPSTAEVVGRLLVAVHAGTIGDRSLAARLADPARFTTLRLAPGLDLPARRHPDLAAALGGLRAEQLANRRGLVHGDVRPQRVLLGASRPDAPPALVLVGADCPALADPAWDLATVIAHLLLIGAASPTPGPGGPATGPPPPARADLADDAREAVAHLAAAYLTGVGWEPVAAVEGRAAALVPALVLAALDASPPAGAPHDGARALLTGAARALVARPPRRLGELLSALA